MKTIFLALSLALVVSAPGAAQCEAQLFPTRAPTPWRRVSVPARSDAARIGLELTVPAHPRR